MQLSKKTSLKKSLMELRDMTGGTKETRGRRDEKEERRIL